MIGNDWLTECMHYNVAKIRLGCTGKVDLCSPMRVGESSQFIIEAWRECGGKQRVISAVTGFLGKHGRFVSELGGYRKSLGGIQ